MTMRGVTNSMGSVVKGMDKAMESMNLERVSSTSDLGQRTNLADLNGHGQV